MYIHIFIVYNSNKCQCIIAVIVFAFFLACTLPYLAKSILPCGLLKYLATWSSGLSSYTPGSSFRGSGSTTVLLLLALTGWALGLLVGMTFSGIT